MNNAENEKPTDGITIANYVTTREILRSHGLTAKKGLGQNFLTDPFVLGKIRKAANLSKSEFVIEIGPGIGGLTEVLVQDAGHVTAYEIDRHMINVLNENLSDYKNLTVVEQDFMTVDLSALPLDKYKFCANLPYNISTAAIIKILESGKASTMLFMVQKEVAKRMQANPGSKDYGSMSLFIRYYAETEIVANVPRGSFLPRPEVDSAVLKLTVLNKPSVSVSDRDILFKLIHAAFATRRKTLVNCLSTPAMGMNKAEAAALLSECGLDSMIRGEAMNLSDFAVLTERYITKCNN